MNTYQGIEATTGEPLSGDFRITEPSEIDVIMSDAQQAYLAYQSVSNEQKAVFLETIASEIEALGNELVYRAMKETGLPEGRIIGERGRTMNQLRLFAALVRKGEWAEATIDTADLNRQPAPKPDLRKRLEPLGPVVVFGASNFPLAYSAAGGDTASALASGCSVVVKAHPAHPGTSQLVADAVTSAAQKSGMPQAIYQHVHDTGFEIGTALVQHPLTAAVGFTGSFNGGKALFDLANKREIPIPVFAEMGSINPVVLLPGEMSERAVKWGETYAGSIQLGCGQFCTNPGLIIGLASDDLNEFISALTGTMKVAASQQMLHDGISTAYHQGKERMAGHHAVEIVYNKTEENKGLGGPCIAKVSGKDFIANPQLREELFGPFSLIVSCENEKEMEKAIAAVDGQLTGTVIGNHNDLETHSAIVNRLKSKVGRLIFNGVPTGVEVATAMTHGGPFPATTDARFTAVGGDAIKRFARPVSYQNCPEAFLPEELKNENKWGIYRRVNGVLTNQSIE